MITASVRFRRKNAPMKTSMKKKKNTNLVYTFWYMTMTSDHPSREIHWNTVNMAQSTLSKLVTPKLGFLSILPQK